jgi:hypothetical protein
MKKIGLISMVLVFALGALGVGYAAWWDEIDINQTVETGSVEIGVIGVASGNITKTLEDGTVLVVAPVTVTNETPKLVKLIEAADVPIDALQGTKNLADTNAQFYQSTTVDIDNWFPSESVREDFIIGYAGSVPVKLQVDISVTDPDGVYDHTDIILWKVYHNGVQLAAGGGAGQKATVNGSWEAGELGEIVAALEGLQLHECDVVIVYIDKHLQQQAPQGSQEATFTIDVDAVQWNLYPYDLP